MSDHEESKAESIMEKIGEKLHGNDSSSDSDDETSSLKSKVFRIFGREKPVHRVFGGGKVADVFLWRNKKISAGVLEVSIPEEPIMQFAEALKVEINRGSRIIKEIAIGRDLKKFLSVIVGLWILSILGSCFNFLTLFYIVFVLLLTLPVLYEKYEDKVDPFAEKAIIEIKKHYAGFDAKVLSKIPRGPLKDKKKD